MEREGPGRKRKSQRRKGRRAPYKGRAREAKEGKQEAKDSREGSDFPLPFHFGSSLPLLPVPFPLLVSFPGYSLPCPSPSPFVPFLLHLAPSFFTWPLPSSPGPFLLYLEVRGQVKKEGDEGKRKGERKDSRDLRGKGRAMG